METLKNFFAAFFFPFFFNKKTKIELGSGNLSKTGRKLKKHIFSYISLSNNKNGKP